ncbi:uncharacterized protein LOC143135995 isoform X2 [Alosa pseudoharengus]|uniref:uncharacterized protein LOC143135995 isoform X2 n=1 Tax=Alosa pseudoharengus TaxID=34774 RepID=UPI003F8CD1F5
MQPQCIEKEEPSSHSSVLRLLTSPLRLLCASIWQVVQEKDVLNYGMLEEFVTLITESVPEVLSHRQRAQLLLGLRAKVVLEVCRSESSADTETIQYHLERIRIPAALLAESSIRDADVETSESNFLALVDILLNDPVERDVFFQEVFPVEYGPKFDLALQRLIWIFVSRLEEVLRVPSIHEVASMLSLAPSIMEECFQALSHPQELLNSLNHHKNHADIQIKAILPEQPSTDDDCIFSCLSHPPLVRVVLDPERKVSEIELEPSYCEEVSVECEEVSAPATEDVKSDEPMSTGSDAEDRTEESAESANCQHDGANVDSEHHERSVCEEAKVVPPKEMPTPAEELEEPSSSEKATSKGIGFINGDGTVDYTGRATVEDRPEGSEVTEDGAGILRSAEAQPEELLSKPVHCSSQTVSTQGARVIYLLRQPTVKLERINITGKPLPPPLPRQSGRVRKKRLQLVWRKNRSPEIVWVDSQEEPDPKNVSSAMIPRTDKSDCGVKPPAVVFACSKCSFQDVTGAILEQHLRKSHPNEFSRFRSAGIVQTSGPESPAKQTDVSVRQTQPAKIGQMFKARPVGARTVSDIGQYLQDHSTELQDHSTEGLCCCSGCGKCFQHHHDLERHMSECGVIVVPQLNQALGSGESSNKPGSTGLNEEITEVQGDVYKKLKQSSGILLKEDKVEGHVDTCHKGLDIPENKGSEHASDSTQDQRAGTAGSDSTLPPECRRTKICPACGKTYTRAFQMRQHYLKKHQKNTSNADSLQRLQCGRKFSDASKLTRHKRARSLVSMKCTMCEDTFTELASLQQHFLKAHSHNIKNASQGSPCEENFTKILPQHQSTNTSKHPYPCSLCPESFLKPHLLARHLRTHGIGFEHKKAGQDPQHLCHQCGERFRTAVALRKHEMTHGEERPYICDRCGKAFKVQVNLSMHMGTHSEPHERTRYRCSDCGKVLISRKNVMRHRLMHSGERPHQCVQCKKSFLSHDELQKHMRYHADKPFKCGECGKCYVQSSYLREHMHTHTHERPFACSVCDKRFMHRTNRKRHMMRIHPTGESGLQPKKPVDSSPQTMHE